MRLKVKNEKELAKMRLALDPNDPNKVVKIDSLYEQPEETGQGIPRSAKSEPSQNNCDKDFASNGNRGNGVSVRPGGDGENNAPAQVSAIPNAQSEVAEAGTGSAMPDVISVAESNVPPESGNDHRLRELFKKAAAKLGKASHLEKAALGFLRKSTAKVFEAGQLLFEAKGILKNAKKWEAWLKEYDIPRSTAWESIELVVRAKTQAAIAGLTITEAKQKFGIYPPKRGAVNTVAAQIRNDNHGGKPDGHESTKAARAKSKHIGAAAEFTDTPATEWVEKPQVKSKNIPATKSVAEEPAMTLPLLEPAFLMTEADEDAFAVFVLAAGGMQRAAQVFQTGYKRHTSKDE